MTASDIRAVALNVRSLPAKLEFLLALPFDVFCLSEVRTSWTGQRALTRLASSLGFAAIWSVAPPPSPTFAVAPGGCAFFARSPLVVEELRPPALEKWRNEARVCVARILDLGGNSVCVASCYGYPPSHPRREANEAYLRDVLSYLGELKAPSLLLGDFNDHPSTSRVLAQSHTADMYRVTNDDPTTLTKNGELAAKLPIDHCFANRAALHLGTKAKVDPTLRVSDHLPILVSIPSASSQLMCVEWAKPTKNLPPKIEATPWTALPCDFFQWQEAARDWLHRAHSCNIEQKGTVRLKAYETCRVKEKHVRFRRLLTLQRAIVEWQKYPKSSHQLDSIRRKIRALGYQSWMHELRDAKKLLCLVAKEVSRVTHVHKRHVLKKWRSRVREWSVSDKAAYRYLRNPLPSKPISIRTIDSVLVQPCEVETALMTYWQGLETWSDEQYAKARLSLEEYYSFLLPRHEHTSQVLPMHLHDVAKRAKVSAVGVDGWTHEELASLPMVAWHCLLLAISISPLSLLASASSIFKRVPISKTSSSVCEPKDVRPIDIFSVIMRIYATATTRIVKPWAQMVLHPGQHATQGGVLVAVARIAWQTELSLAKVSSLWGISVDFEKMFNMLSGLVAAEVAGFMGLSYTNILDLLVPVACAVGIWKLPFSAAPKPFGTPRGLPQGMASSVLLAELAIAPVLWRLTRAVQGLTVCAYVDDLNLVVDQRPNLSRTVQILREFEDHFSLSLSEAKTHVWASEESTHAGLQQETGFRVEKSVNALGAEWPTNRAAKLTSKKELARLEECSARLLRAKALPMPAPKLALIVSTGCLSLLDFVNLADPKPYLKLRSAVKDVFDMRAGAPEVVSCLLIRGSLDPQDCWLMSILRLWYLVLQQHPSKEYVDEVIEQARGRLGIGAVHAYRWGITVSCDGFQVGVRWVPSREQWFIVRKVLMVHLKAEHARRLAERRPLLFGGLSSWNVRQHNRLLMMVTPYERKVLLRLWSGSSMCQHKRQQIYGEEAKCMCGHEDQSIWHLLWQCPCVPPPLSPLSIESTCRDRNQHPTSSQNIRIEVKLVCGGRAARERSLFSP